MLLTLKRIVQEVAQIPELDVALECLTQRLKDAMQADCCSVYLADYQQQHFTLMATDGLAKDAVGDVCIGFSEGLIGLIGQREEPINIEDAHLHPRFKYYPEVQEENFHAFLGTPIIHQRKVLGVLTVQQKRKRKFSEDEEAFLVTLAAQIALEVKHAEIRGKLAVKDVAEQISTQKTINGGSAAEGLAIGIGVIAGPRSRLKHQILMRSKQAENEKQRYLQAVQATRDDIHALSEKMRGIIPDDAQEVFQLYQHLLETNSLGQEVETKICQGWTAISALKMVVEKYIGQFLAMEDSYMRERATDIEDLGNRVLSHLLLKSGGDAEITDDSILVAEEVTASMLAEFPHDKLKGVISLKGTQNSHAAILIRAMGLPAVMGIDNLPLSLFEGQTLIVDGYSGEVSIAPDKPLVQEYQQLIAEEKQLLDLILSQASEVAETKDGCRIRLLVNAGLSQEYKSETQDYSEGIGLFRTEIPFMLQERFPSELEQTRLYQQVLAANSGKVVTMRTLDVGGDKPLSYFPIAEENPFLGWRGIRLTLDHPEIFLVQIRAMLRASFGLQNLQIMLPMISSVSEVDEALRLIHQAFFEMNEEASSCGQVLYMPKVGVMLEVPAVLYQIPELAARVDFFSVGSNDLTQYMLAVDRNNNRVASLCDSYHPAVLRALYNIVQQSDELKTPVTLCGEMAGEPAGAILLIAMGYRNLSMSTHNLRKVKWVLRNTSLTEVQSLLAEIMLMSEPAEVKHKLNLFLESMGAGGLVRAGK